MVLMRNRRSSRRQVQLPHPEVFKSRPRVVNENDSPGCTVDELKAAFGLLSEVLRDLGSSSPSHVHD